MNTWKIVFGVVLCVPFLSILCWVAWRLGGEMIRQRDWRGLLMGLAGLAAGIGVVLLIKALVAK